MELMAQGAAVLGVLCLVLATTWLLRKGSPVALRMRRRGRLVEVVDHTIVSPQLSIAVIRIQGAEWILAAHAAGLQVLEHRPGSTAISK